MARMPRLAVAGQPHLVVQRANGARPVFVDAQDRLAYLAALRDVAPSSGVAVHAYALLDDAVLLLLTPRESGDLGAFMQRVGRRYVPGFHRRHGGSGRLWAGRYEAAALEPERYLLAALLLVEQAPVRAGLASAALDWPWSSARHHTGRGAAGLVTEHAVWWRLGNTPFEREARHDIELQRMLGGDQVAAMLGATRGGWPLGSAAFTAAIAGSGDRPVRPRPRGRPRRSHAVSS
jgi:putative transposase